MSLVTAGKINKQVAFDLGLSEITVKTYRGAVMEKMAARSFANLVRMADALKQPAADSPAGSHTNVCLGYAPDDRRLRKSGHLVRQR